MVFVCTQDLKDECCFQYILNWDLTDANRHFYTNFDTTNYKKVMHFNIFSRKFIFNFTDDFQHEVEATCEVFREHILSEAYLIACHFKVIDMYMS